jgi:hypothetical protein
MNKLEQNMFLHELKIVLDKYGISNVSMVMLRNDTVHQLAATNTKAEPNLFMVGIDRKIRELVIKETKGITT